MKNVMLLAMLFVAAFAQAQVNVTGVVTNKTTGRPVTGATVTIQNFGTHTDNNGRYYLRLRDAGTYPLMVSFIGYTTYLYPTSFTTGDNTINVSLEETGLFVKPVEISSLRAGATAPFTKSSLSAEDIKKQNLGQDLPMLLNQLPGVVTNSDAGAGIGYTNFRVRGSDVTRVNITVNGIPINDAESQGVFFVNMPDFASSVNSIQLQRGVGTSTNGAGAFGASLNLSTNTFNDKAYAEVDNSYGSFNSWKHTVKAGTGLLNDHFTVDARLSKITSDGYIDRATSDLQSFYTSAAYIAKKTAVRLNVFGGKEKTYQAWNGIDSATLADNRRYNSSGTEKPGEPYDNETDNYQQTHYQLSLNQGITDNLNFNVALHLTRGKGYYESYYGDDSYTEFGLPNPVVNGTEITETDMVRQLWLDNYFYGGVFSINHSMKKFNWSLGGGWNKYDGDHYGKIIWAQNGGIDKDHKWYDLDATKTDVNVYWKGEYSPIEKLSVFADMQYRHVGYDINGFRKRPNVEQHNKYNFFNPKVGVTYHVNNFQYAYASFAIGNKEPNRDDFEAGTTQTPEHETLRNLEAGYVYTSQRVGLQANVYYMNYKNQLVLTGKINDVGAYTRSNIPESYRLGLELQGSVKLGSYVDVAANIALSRNKIKDFTEYIDDYDNGGQKEVNHGETDISFSPDVTGGYTFTVKPVKGLNIDLLGKYVSRQYLDNTSIKRRSLDGYYVQDVRINYLVPQKLVKELGLQLMLNNVFNKMYVPNGYTFSYIEGGQLITGNGYLPMAGFNVMGGVHIGF
ncbi:TonB-dependent receptor [Chitinophaga horti]|uniref:TonB-dependent receptor n=1 Tax=Chitinophaga horti TaxID=2920382 RepID=A0ABY6J0B6_9BACT|nr:TonB-dependent receptor [Chitinophaga horti]UYQ91592.1 TonB-dependent receptor [Chitinophaga horti]